MLKFYVYELKLNTMQEDWSDKTDPGVLKPTATIIDRVVVDDFDVAVYLGGYGKDGNCYQYCDREAYYATEYFEQKFETHGLFVESYSVVIPLKDLEKYKVK